MKEKNWVILDADNTKVEFLKSELKLPDFMCRILVQRHIDSLEKAHYFFSKNPSHLFDPFLMKDMDRATQKIKNALDNKLKILIIGDYDVDGTTSVSILYMFLSKLSPLVSYYIPNRFKEGYGISEQSIEYAIEHQIQLIITVDCGIKSVQFITKAASAGIETIISDHHLPGDTLPPAVAILNPKQSDCLYPDKNLCGCGIVFKLICALSNLFDFPKEKYTCFFDYVALATCADIVPMIGENRLLTNLGIEKMNTHPSFGIQALMQSSNLNKLVKVKDVVFVLAPRINAAGRMNDAKDAVSLFTATDFNTALEYAQQLNKNNTERKVLDKETYTEALSMIFKDSSNRIKKTTVVYNDTWNKGVIGIVASRLVEEHYKPTIVFTKSGEILTGSARSVDGFNIYEAIADCHDYLLSYGGHFAAAGMTLPEANYEKFSSHFEQYVRKHIKPEHETPTLKINALLDFKDINFDMYNMLQRLEPYGPENLEPIFMTEHVYDTGYSRIVKDHHIQFTLKQNQTKISGIGFNLAFKFPIVKSGSPFKIVYKIMSEIYQDKNYLKLFVLDINY